MMRAYLIRHGSTDLNDRVPAVWQGCRLDPPLNERGRWQAQRARDLLASFPLTAVYSSPLQRARQTAEIIAEPHGLTVQLIDALREADVGRWEGRATDDILQEEPDYYRLFLQDPATYGYPGGESFADVFRRAFPALQQILERHPQEQIAIVWHNVVGRVCLAELIGLPISRARQLTLSNGGISVVERNADSTRVRTINSCFHLTE